MSSRQPRLRFLRSPGQGMVGSPPKDEERESMVKRSLVAVFIVALCPLLTATAAFAASPETRYVVKVNTECRQLTADATTLVQAYVRAKASGRQKAAGVAFVELVLAGANAYVRILDIPVPPTLQGKMLPVRLNMLGQVEGIEGMTRSKTDAEYKKYASRVDTLSAKADRLFDAAGLQDCGSRQTRAIAAASRG